MNNKILDNKNISVPICVDLDGTLISTDILYESIILLIKKNIIYIFIIPFWLVKGKAYLKQNIASRVNIDVGLIPYNKNFLEYLKKQKDSGRILILSTASNEKYAKKICEHVQIFNGYIASNSKKNLSGKLKLENLIKTYGVKGFDYAGNSKDDLIIWNQARKSFIVNPNRNVLKKATKFLKDFQLFEKEPNNFLTYLKAIRCHQWIKNLLIFVPLITAHKIFDPVLLIKSFIAFISFSFCASSVYVLNDLFDLFSDRKNSIKCKRAFAAGVLSIKNGIYIILLFLPSSFLIAINLGLKFTAVLLLYLITTTFYSFILKKVVLLDIIILAALYTLRIIAGSSAVAIVLSFWLLLFSMFIFLSLALVKRFSELIALKNKNESILSGRGYLFTDLEIISQFGVSSGFMAILILALYINSDQVKALYKYPQYIWILCPILLYWISRVWLLTHRNRMHSDPVVFAIKDRISHIMVLLSILTLWLAS